MRTTVKWMRRHKLGMLGLCVAMTAIMIMPENADAGWRRRARRCWRQGGYWVQPFVYSNYGYSNRGYSNYGYRGQNFGYSNSGTHYGVRGSYQSGTQHDGTRGVQGNVRSNMDADIDTRGSFNAARPDLNETDDDLAPPAPLDQNSRIDQQSDIDAQGRIQGQNRAGAEADVNSQTGEEGNVRSQGQSDIQTRQRSGAEAELNGQTDADANATSKN